MDSKRFNELAKALASGQSRRGIVKGLAAGFLGSAAALIGRRADAARIKRGPGRLCREDANCEEFALCRSNGLRKICTCSFCYEDCVQSCFAINSTFSFNQGVPCAAACAIECSEGFESCDLG